LGWNYSIDRALEYAEKLRKPLLIFEALDVGYPWASDRHHQSIISGMKEHRERLESLGTAYYAYIEPQSGAGRGLLQALASRACIVVTDDSPVFFTPRMIESAKRLTYCRVEAVDSCGLLPIRAADRDFVSAYQFRRFLQRMLPNHLEVSPDPDPLPGARIPSLPSIPGEIMERWPLADTQLLQTQKTLASLPIDHSVGPTPWWGGHASAEHQLHCFIAKGLPRYGEDRNNPDSGASSGLSPWLHHGHISPHEIFEAVAESENWTPAHLSQEIDGRRSGWWGMTPTAEAFLDQLVTWRELSFVFCSREARFDCYDTLPAWAVKTLEDHAGDPREHVYTLEQFMTSSTHDELWNAAQRQLMYGGVIHNYLRMFWGKKILEWSTHPREAFETMIELNNRFALDGRDPNSYTGISWVMGRFDRGWPERPIYGKVRSMTSSSTRRKLKLDEYLVQWGT
jgi:deoxyribodipyrimidine photo-lyase